MISEEHRNLIWKYEYSCRERTVNKFLKSVWHVVPYIWILKQERSSKVNLQMYTSNNPTPEKQFTWFLKRRTWIFMTKMQYWWGSTKLLVWSSVMSEKSRLTSGKIFIISLIFSPVLFLIHPHVSNSKWYFVCRLYKGQYICLGCYATVWAQWYIL